MYNWINDLRTDWYKKSKTIIVGAKSSVQAVSAHISIKDFDALVSKHSDKKIYTERNREMIYRI